jgi:hypothetical protein
MERCAVCLPVGDRSVRSDGAFSFAARPDKVGLAVYRVVTSKGTDFVGSSDRVPVRVLHWTYLDSSEEFTYLVPIVGDLNRGPAASGGARFEHAVSLDAGCYNAWSGSAWIDYPLQRRYETFSASVALGGAAASGSTATYSVIGGDGEKLASGSLVFGGTAQKIRASVGDEYRLRLRINVPDPTNAGACSTSYTQVVFGNAELLGP